VKPVAPSAYKDEIAKPSISICQNSTTRLRRQ
jgi:hypothetical protein